jgi:hypothetical protein
VFVQNHGDLAAEMWAQEKATRAADQREPPNKQGYVSVLGDHDPTLNEPPVYPGVKQSTESSNFDSTPPATPPDREPDARINNPICVIDPFIRDRVSRVNCLEIQVDLYTYAC